MKEPSEISASSDSLKKCPAVNTVRWFIKVPVQTPFPTSIYTIDSNSTGELKGLLLSSSTFKAKILLKINKQKIERKFMYLKVFILNSSQKIISFKAL